MATTAIIFPANQQWAAFGREVVPGTVAAPVATMPVDKPEPDNKPTILEDKSLVGTMATDGPMILGTTIADMNMTGNVFLDTIGFPLHNVFGDYVATGTISGSADTLAAPCVAGAATISTTLTHLAGVVLQLGSTGFTENVTVASVTGSGPFVLTLTKPTLYAHANASSAQPVIAPFTHIFSVLNSGNGQPVTHSITHYNAISGSFGARQYASWCCSDVDFTIDPDKIFSHATKGQAYLGSLASSAITNSFSAVPPVAGWQFLVGIGGPATGGTLLNNVNSAGITVARTLKAWYGANAGQNPFIIGRAGLTASGKFTFLAQDESPLLNLLGNTQPQLQLKMTNGLTGANLLSIQFDVQVGTYMTTKQNEADHITYEVAWKGVRNTTNAGASGGVSPIKVTVSNAVASF